MGRCASEFTIPQCCSLPYALLGLTITLCDFERKGILVIAVPRPPVSK